MKEKIVLCCKSKKIIALIIIIIALLVVINLSLIKNVEYFVPMLHNLVILSKIGVVTVLFIVMMILAGKFIKYTVLKMLSIIILSIIFALWMFIAFVIYVFAHINAESFEYNNKTYYYEDVSWLDINYIFYEKNNIFIMSKLTDEEVKNIFLDTNYEINDKEAKEVIKYLKERYYQSKNKVDVKIPDNNVNEENEHNNDIAHNEDSKNNYDYEYYAKILERADIKNAIEISNSNYAIIPVDKAMHLNRWFFVEIIDGKAKFISELLKTSVDARGSVEEDGSVCVEFIYVDASVIRYISKDLGKTWEKLE